MRVTRDQLRMIVEHALAEGSSGRRMYRCFDGSLVPFGSPDCMTDIAARMADARHIRDACDNRTDKREYYNGVLKVLRREMREAEKAKAQDDLLLSGDEA